MQDFMLVEDELPATPRSLAMVSIDRDLIPELQNTVLLRCEERIASTGRSSVSHYREAGRKSADRGITGGMRLRHGL